ncbi:hypothetical protein JXB31_04740 [Candidatus Woesearchaeota archaeon]|nr:hypothetical protein [Candidatus Woesearchaeota archaeon]
MGMKKRCQVSLEYMLMVGFTLLLIIPIVMIYGSEKQAISDQVSFSQASQIATKITDSVETVYYLGKPSQTTIRVYFPQNIDEMIISDNEVVIRLNVGNTITEAVSISQVNMSGNLDVGPGIHEILIIAEDEYVNITEK